MTLLQCNADFENFLVGDAVGGGKAMDRARMVARLFALMGPPGSQVVAMAAGTSESLDADAIRLEARTLDLYDDETARAAPWLAEVIPYAWDERTSLHAALSKAVNSKAFSHTLASENGLEPGVFRQARLIHSVEEIPAQQSRWTLKPLWGFAGGGRLHGDARGLNAASLQRLPDILARDGALLFEPWVDRIDDVSTQILVTPQEVRVLMHCHLYCTPAGRYQGNGTWTQETHVPELRRAALMVGNALQKAGYVGVAGIDAFTFTDPLDGKVQLRPLVEINARFTLGLITGWMAVMHAARRGPSPWRFELDVKQPFGTWSFLG